jgi:hypothetical protein
MLFVFAKYCAGCSVEDDFEYSHHMVPTCTSLGDDFYNENQGWTHRHCNAAFQRLSIICEIPGPLNASASGLMWMYDDHLSPKYLAYPPYSVTKQYARIVSEGPLVEFPQERGCGGG